MSDYYQLPPPEKKRSFKGAVLLLLLLLLLGIVATWWSLRLQPGEVGVEPVLSAQSVPAVTLAPPVVPETVEDVVEPIAETEVAAAPEPVAEPATEPAPPPPLFSDARWRETARFPGADSTGRIANFTAYVLVGEETWTYARSDAIFAAGLNEPVETAFANLNLGAGVCDLNRVIAVGAASVEGTSIQNTLLSYARGTALRTAIAANLPCEAGAVPTSMLDLGYSRAEVVCPAGEKVCPDVSAPQRPIAMILADAADPETDIGEALRSGIAAHEASGASVFPDVRVSDYSAFDLR